MNPEITVIIPAKDEEESLSELCQWISRVMLAHGFSYEVIFIDDGSTDNTWQEIQKINVVDSRFKGKENKNAKQQNPKVKEGRRKERVSSQIIHDQQQNKSENSCGSAISR